MTESPESDIQGAAAIDAGAQPPANGETPKPQAEAVSTDTSSAEATSAPLETSHDAGGGEAAPSRDADSGDADSSESGDEGDASESAAGDVAAEGPPGAEGDAPKRKRRRRRKKKPHAEGAPGEEGAVAEGGASPSSAGFRGRPDRGGDRPERREPHVPFRRFFDHAQQGDRRHAFSAGEIVAGRVLRITDEVILVDLFGKAIAVIDRWDAREPEDIPEEAKAAEAASNAAESAPKADVSAAEGATRAQESGQAGEAAQAVDASSAPTAPGSVEVMRAITIGEVTTAADGTLTAAESELEAAQAADDVAEDADAEDDDVEDVSGEHDVAGAGRAEAAPQAPIFEPEPEGPPPEAPPVGSIVRGRVGSVSESSHIALVNKYIPRGEIKAKLVAARDARQRVRGIVFGFNRGGFDVLVQGVRVFCPANGMSLTPIDDPHALVGEKLEFTIPPRKGKTKGIVVSRRTILEREAVKRRKTVLKALTEGQELVGHVTQVREFGAFVDIGDGLEGMVHQSELGWKHGIRPGDVVRPGDEIRVKVLGIKRDGKKLRNTRIALSAKALMPDPWDEHAAVLTEGTPTKGTVVGATEFGAFLRLADGIEGLLHISELGRDLTHASQAVKIGDELDVVVDRVDRRQRRISLSKLSPADAKALAEGGTIEPRERPMSLKPGSHIKVVVAKVDHAGLQVQVAGVLGKRGRGFIPIRELGSKTSGDGRQGIAVGTEIEVKIVGTDRQGGLRLSVRGLETDTERQAVKEYRKEVAKQGGFGTFGDLLRAKLAPGGSSDEKS